MIKEINFKKLFISFIIFNIFYAIFYLYIKHSVGNDSSISEYLINYKGGFTRRGLGGEVSILIANFFDFTLRQSIFIFQSTAHVIYLLLVFAYVKDLKLNIIQLFALFSPIFLLYPIAEIEVLGRKDLLLFLLFITSIFFSGSRYSPIILNSIIFIFFPIICLMWEEIVIFAPYFAVLVIFKNNLPNFKQVFVKLLIIFTPSLIIFFIIFVYPLSKEGHIEMCNYLLTNFGEQCYMSAKLLVSNTIYFDTFDFVHKNASIEHYFRYLMIFVVGFLPLNLLVMNNSFLTKSNYINSNFKLNLLFFILYSPTLLLFIYGYDWGRWINIMYTFSILLYFYFLRNNLITNNTAYKNFLLIKIVNNKKYLIPIFFIFAFCWNPKTVITGDIATNSLYKIVYNSSKIIFDFESVRIFQDNPLIKFHQKYIE